MPRRLPDDVIAAIRVAYLTPDEDGTWVGSTTIARQFGISPTAVVRHLRDAGIAIRTAKEAHANGKRCKPITNVPIGEQPGCKCGCGAAVDWDKGRKKWRPYFGDHYRNPPGWKRPERMRYRAGFIGPREESRYRGSPGDRNGSWKGGVTPERQRLYRTTEWKDLISAVWRRDAYHCQRCGTGKDWGKALHAHHVIPWADAPALRMEASNLITLCRDCHLWVHSLANVEGAFLGCAIASPQVPAAGGGGYPFSARAA